MQSPMLTSSATAGEVGAEGAAPATGQPQFTHTTASSIISFPQCEQNFIVILLLCNNFRIGWIYYILFVMLLSTLLLFMIVLQKKAEF